MSPDLSINPNLPTGWARYKFYWTAGLLVRNSIKKGVLDYCWSQGLDCQVQEVKRFGRSTYYFTITGPENAIMQAVEDIQRWAEEIAYNP